MDLLNLQDRRILITGGLGAIGQVMVRVLAAHGATVLVNDILPESEAQAILADPDMPVGAVTYIRADCSDAQAVSDMFLTLAQGAGLPHVVCCHAGLVHVNPIQDFSLQAFDETLNLNLRAAFLVAQTAVRHWQIQDMAGHLIFTTSWVQDVPWPEIAAYSVSKSGMRTLMRSFARELAADGIRANAIAPGIVGVGMARRQWDTDPSYQARARKAIPLGDLQTPESVAHAFLFLCSNMATYMTGSVLLVDGGCSLYPMD